MDLAFKKVQLDKPVVAQENPCEAGDLLVAYLEQLGIEYIFGIPGGAIEPLYNAMARSSRRGGLRPIVARHESGAAFMADGYARETGKVGVCCATSGPGATNMITGVACAYDNAIPLLVITGQPALPLFGKHALQESSCTGVDTVSMFRHCTRYNTLVSHVDQLETKLVHALTRAHQMPHGPVHLSIPVDILRSALKSKVPTYRLDSLLHKPSLFDEQLVQRLHDEVTHADNIVFLIGGHSCGEAIDAIMELIELTDALFVTAPDAKGLINPRHPRYRGVFGFAGHLSADAVLREQPDLILALGTSLGEWASGAWSDKVLNQCLIHIDSSDENLLRSPMARLHVRGRIRSVCERLLTLLKMEAGVRQRRGGLDKPLNILHQTEEFISDAAPIKPQRLMRELSNCFPLSTRFIADTGNSTAWAIHYLQPRDRRIKYQGDSNAKQGSASDRVGHNDSGWLRVVMDFAPMGWAIGGAIGIARGNSTAPVVCITGDGSYLMNGQEITVAVAERLTVIFVVLNDAALGMVKHGQRLTDAEPIGFEMPSVDFCMQAASMGVPAYRIDSPADMQTLDMKAILQQKGPTVLDVHIDGEAVPPMNLRLQALRA